MLSCVITSRALLLISGTMVLLCFGVKAQAQEPKKDVYPNLGALFSKDTRDQALIYQFQGWRETSAQQLLEIIKDNREVDEGRSYASKTGLALIMLGELRAVETAEYLLTIIQFRVKEREVMREEHRHPATFALIQIGKKGSLLCLNQIGKEDDRTRRMLMARVVYHVETEVIGRMILQANLAEEKDEARRKRWVAAIADFEDAVKEGPLK